MAALDSPRIEVTSPTGSGMLRIALDCGFIYHLQLMDAILNEGYHNQVEAGVAHYYEPLTATLVLEALQAWHSALAARLSPLFKAAIQGEAPFRATETLELMSGLLWEAS